MPISPDPSTASGYSYTSPVTPKAKHVWLATIICSIVAGVSVTVFGLMFLVGAEIISSALGMNLSIDRALSKGTSPLIGGAMIAAVMSAYNLILFPIVLPITWGALALTLGRLRWKGRTERKPYMIAGSLTGAVLVGLTTGLFGGFLPGDLLVGISAGFFGALIGASAGFICSLVFLGISRPPQSIGLNQVDAF